MCSKRCKSSKVEQVTNTDSKFCLNCGVQLNGQFCHACGQDSTKSNSTARSFVLEYLGNALLWDPKHIRTIWHLISRPGFLTKEFLSGKYVSYVHPLKLNMFILFVFITVFLLFSSRERLNSPVQEIADDEGMLTVLHLETLKEDPAFVAKLADSPRDTVRLHAPLLLAENHPDILGCVEVVENAENDSLDKWVAVIPSLLVEENIVVPATDGYYRFNIDSDKNVQDILLVFDVWKKLVDLTTDYFPMFVLLTTPFLSLSMRLVQRRKEYPRINYFIFCLHYIAFLELLMLSIYLVYLVSDPPMWAMETFWTITSCVYLTMAFRNVYGINLWIKALAKAVCLSLIYSMIILLLLVCNLIVSCFIVLLNSGYLNDI